MQLMIEIDNEHYERIMRFEEGVTVYPTTLALYEAVKNGTPLTERPKGKWILNSDYPDRLICEKCNAQFDVWHWESKQMHFCPNCGSYNGGGGE